MQNGMVNSKETSMAASMGEIETDQER